MARGDAKRRSITCSRSSSAIANGTTTGRASSWFSSSRPGARPTRPPSTAASGYRRSCFRNGRPLGLAEGARLRAGGQGKQFRSHCRAGRATMPINAVYQGPGDLADVIPVFPLPGALLLPRGQMPLNIFEPRYLAMIDDALRGHRLIGMIQPDGANPGPENKPNLYKVGCVGRITQLAETGDGRYLLQLTGIARFRIDEELRVSTPYRQCRVTYTPFTDDFTARKGEDEVDRASVLRALSDFLTANNLKADWEGIENAPNEALVNALAMMSPYGTAEKQALLEAPDLKTRAEILVAATEIELAKKSTGGETSLQ